MYLGFGFNVRRCFQSQDGNITLSPNDGIIVQYAEEGKRKVCRGVLLYIGSKYLTIQTGNRYSNHKGTTSYTPVNRISLESILKMKPFKKLF